ncbi:MAG: hypothetical protein ACRENT_06125 [Thermodesulfobacteriota bacterium]
MTLSEFVREADTPSGVGYVNAKGFYKIGWTSVNMAPGLLPPNAGRREGLG